MQRMSLSGKGFTGSDIGGFAEQPSGELYARWIQLGVFHPFCRTHSSGDHGDQEPWSFDADVVEIARKFISLRYQLLPYLYTMFWQYVNQGVPMLKPLVYFDQQDTQTHYRTDEFIFGNQILVCPILEPNALGRRMYVPAGNWYNYWTGEMVAGGRELWVSTDYDQIPVFIKEGAVIPKYPVQQYVGEKRFDEIALEAYFKHGKEKSVLYEDAEDGYDYNKERYCLSTFTLAGKEGQLVIGQHQEGKFETPYGKYRVVLHGLPFAIAAIEIDNEKVAPESVMVGNNVLLIDKNFTELHITG
jgi:alpha-glucosidase